MILTAKILKQISPNANPNIIATLEQYMDTFFVKYNVNTYMRICHFLAQAAEESDGFKTLQEYASGSAYEGRHDLGNTQAGDGVRYKGRGIFEITGRANYKTYGDKISVDLVNNPQLAADGKNSLLTALEYWNDHGLSIYADHGDITSITKKINGGLNGLSVRQEYLNRALSIIPKDISLSTANIVPSANIVSANTNSVPVPSITNSILYKKGDSDKSDSSDIEDFQTKLHEKGYAITPDGKFGPLTEAAIRQFQTANNLEVNGMIDTNTSAKVFF